MKKKRRGLHDPARAGEPSLFDFGADAPATPPTLSAPTDVPAPDQPAGRRRAAAVESDAAADSAVPSAPAAPSAPSVPAAGSGARRSALPWRSSQEKPYTIAQINGFTKQLLEETFTGIWVEGEMAEIKRTPQNHLFFKLKDADAQLDGRMWNSYRARLKFVPEPGMKVLVNGRIEFYEKRGQVSLNAWRIEPTGVGALQVALEQLKQRLLAEGLFDRPKRPLPEFPGVIGLVTSAGGAALRDMLKVLGQRWPVARVVIAPAQVQGDSAPAAIVKALKRLYTSKLCDVIVVGRGGGSGEDLAAFNAETVVRAIAQSPVTIVSAVGHETDTTLSDYAADHRAPTPTGAAQVIAPDRRQVREYIRQQETALRGLIVDQLIDAGETWRELERHIRRARPAGRVQAQAQTWVELDEALRDGIRGLLQTAGERRQRLAERVTPHSLRLHLTAAANRAVQIDQALRREGRALLARPAATVVRHSERLAALSPLNVLARGYSVTQAVAPDGTPGAVVRTVAAARRAGRLRTRLTDGSVDSELRE